MRRDRTKLIIGILVAIIVVLILIVGYALFAKPAFSSYILDKQVQTYNQGVSDVLTYMISDLQQNGYTSITIGNQTVVLAPLQVQSDTGTA